MYRFIFSFLLVFSLVPGVSFAHSVTDDPVGDVGEGVLPAPCEADSVINCEGVDVTLESAVGDLLRAFAVSSVNELDCEEIIDHDFAHVGEALMDYMHPEEEEHERIDGLMGGEGSESLEAMHVFMGKRYLGCVDGSYGPMMMGFGSPLNVSDGGREGWGMMRDSDDLPHMASRFFDVPFSVFPFWGGLFIISWIFDLLWLGLAVLGVVWIVQNVRRKKGK